MIIFYIKKYSLYDVIHTIYEPNVVEGLKKNAEFIKIHRIYGRFLQFCSVAVANLKFSEEKQYLNLI